MERKLPNQRDFRPDCDNDNDELSSSSSNFNIDNCCSSCCSCDNNVGTDVDVSILSPIDPEDVPKPGRAMFQKLDMLKCLSLARTNRERSAIQNVLQFIEALTYSNSFIRRYNSQECYCEQGFQDSNCHCYVRNEAHLSLVDSCSCSRCDAPSDISEETTSIEQQFSDCSPTLKEPTEEKNSKNRRNRRRRVRRRNSRLMARRTSNRSRQEVVNPERSTNSSRSDCDYYPRLMEVRFFNQSRQVVANRERSRDSSTSDYDYDSRLMAVRSSNQLRQPVSNIERKADSSRCDYDSDCSHCRRRIGRYNLSSTTSNSCNCDSCLGDESKKSSRNNVSFNYSVEDCNADCPVECSNASDATQRSQSCNIPNCYECNRGIREALRSIPNSQPCLNPNCDECNVRSAERTTSSEDCCNCPLAEHSGEFGCHGELYNGCGPLDPRRRGCPEGQTDPSITDSSTSETCDHSFTSSVECSPSECVLCNYHDESPNGSSEES